MSIGRAFKLRPSLPDGGCGVACLRMAKRKIILQAVVALVVVWAVVAVVKTYAGSKRSTAVKIERTIADANFEDWSEGIPAGADTAARETRLREIADLFNGLDVSERIKARDNRVGEEMYERLADSEKELFVKLTVRKSMESMMQALDAMSPTERRQIVEDGLRRIEDGRTAEEMQRAREISEDMLSQVTEEGMRAYFDKAGADTKLDLAPLMEAMDGVMKGLEGDPFSNRQ